MGRPSASLSSAGRLVWGRRLSSPSRAGARSGSRRQPSPGVSGSPGSRNGGPGRLGGYRTRILSYRLQNPRITSSSTGVFPEGEQRGRVRRASGEDGRNTRRQGCLGRRSGPGTWIFPDIWPPRAPLAPCFHPPETLHSPLSSSLSTPQKCSRPWRPDPAGAGLRIRRGAGGATERARRPRRRPSRSQVVLGTRSGGFPVGAVERLQLARAAPGGPHRVTLRRTRRGARWVVGRTVARAGGMAGTPRGQAGWAGRSWSGCGGCGTPSSCRTLANPGTRSSLPRTGASARAPSLYPSPPLPARSVARTPAVPPPQPPSGSGRGPAAAEIQSAGAGAAPERGRTLTPGARRRPPQVL